MTSRAHQLGHMRRTDLITVYQAQHRYDCYEVAPMDRDKLITAILDGES